MAFAGELLTDATNTINTYGESIRFRKFTVTINSGSYDSDQLLTSGADTWTSGIIQPIGRSEFNLVQQGLLLTNDLKVYVDGSVNVSGTFRIGIGSANPPSNEYQLAPNNLIESPFVNGSPIYKKLFLRVLTTGSLQGE